MSKAIVHRRAAAAALALLLLPGAPASTAGAAPPRGPAAASASAPEKRLTAILLVAQDAVSDPNFAGSIVLVMNDLGPAPAGIILNRPMPLSVSRYFPELKRLARLHDRMYFGGPVEFGTVWFLFRASSAPAAAVRVCDGVYVSSDRKLLLQLLGRRKPMQGLRLFIGHAGWAPGQLQAEIEGGAWTPRRADARSIFNATPRRPWPPPRDRSPGT